MLRNRFLGTASFLFGPNDKPGEGQNDDAGGDQNDNGGQDDASGDDTGANAADDATGDGEADDTTNDDTGADEDDDPDLADLPPEVRAKAKAALEKRLARETGWRDRQIDKLYRKQREAQEDNRALEQIADPARRAPAAGADSDPNRKFTADDVQREAQRLTAQQQYDQNANDADARGRKAYADKWGSTMAKLPKLGGVDVTDMVDILATDKPHVVLFSLADPETYERVMALPPARRRNEFVKLSMKDEPKARRVEGAADSKRPADQAPPVVPLNRGRQVAAQQVNLYDDKAADDAWYAARNASRRKKFTNAE